MLKLTRQQRSMLAEKLLDIANLAAAAMIFGQFVSERRFSAAIAGVGATVWVVLAVCAIRLSRGTS